MLGVSAPDRRTGPSPFFGPLSESLVCPGRKSSSERFPRAHEPARCTQDSMKGLPGMGASRGGYGSSIASDTSHIPTASRTQTALTVIGSSARLPGVSPRIWLGYQSTCPGPASTSPTQSTQVGLPCGPEPLHPDRCAETWQTGWPWPWSRAKGQFSATLQPESLVLVMAVPPMSTHPTGSWPTFAVLSPFHWPNGYSQASVVPCFLFLFFLYNSVVEV